MNEIISKGYLYIAQPPLYKLKKGKMERYVKDEKEFTGIIIGAGVEGVTIESSDGKKTKAEDYKDLLVRIREVVPVLDELEMERLDRRVVVALAEAGITFDVNNWKRADIEKVVPKITELIKQIIPFDSAITVVEEADGEAALKFNTRLRGVRYETFINRKLWISDRMTEVREIFKEADATFGSGPFIARDTNDPREPAHAENLESLVEAIDARGRKGLSITRYKGLGEMNPEQLWETTMDPKNRRLLQVKVDDAIDADQIFTVLMGDEVEPRRKFIEDNALKIRNLDV
jgi:DNA gyrase subunit B